MSRRNEVVLKRAMQRAITLAQRGGAAVSPNPKVGAVLVHNGTIVAEGWHQYFGGPHAECNCLTDAVRKGINPENCTLVVTLEPCNHYGKTPPCSEAVLRARVPDVVIGCVDPSPRAGGGAEFLRRNGVRVQVGVLEQECRDLVADFLHWQASDLPFLTLKMAASLDGFIATRSGQSRWITGAPARRRVHLLRASHHAVLIGGGTLRADDPLLNVRLDDFDEPEEQYRRPGESTAGSLPAQGPLLSQRCCSGAHVDASGCSATCFEGELASLWLHPEPPQPLAQPVAVVLSSRKIDPDALPRLLVERGGATIFVTQSGSGLSGQQELLEAHGARLLCLDLPDVPADFDLARAGDGMFSSQALREVLRLLRIRFGLHRILCEGGGCLGLNLLKAGLVQEFELHQAALLMADRQAVPIFDGLDPAAVSDALKLQLLRVGRLGNDIISKYRPGE